MPERAARMAGKPVDVSVAGAKDEPPVVAMFSGVLQHGKDLTLEGWPQDAEVFMFYLSTKDPNAGAFYLDRAAFKRAAWTGMDHDVLRIEVGNVVLLVEEA